MAPIKSGLVDQKMRDYDGAMQDWQSFMKETKAYYGVDMSALTRPFNEEQKKYYLQVGVIITFLRLICRENNDKWVFVTISLIKHQLLCL